MLIDGAALFGIGFGLLQKAALLPMTVRAPRANTGWEARCGTRLRCRDRTRGIPLGHSFGAFLFGFVMAALGYSWTFYLYGGLVASALVLVRLDRPTPVASRSIQDGR